MQKSRGERGSVKFRVVEFEVEGSDATLHESLRNLAAAIRGGGTVQARALSPKTPKIDSAPAGEPDDVIDHDDDEAAQTEIAFDDDSALRPKAPSRPRSYPEPKVLENLDLNAAKLSLEDFCKQKNPDSESKRYLVIAAWLKEQLGIEGVTIDHVYTCYRRMKWQVPKDVIQPLRDMKRKNGWFSKGDGKGEYRINHIGLNEVDTMSAAA